MKARKLSVLLTVLLMAISFKFALPASAAVLATKESEMGIITVTQSVPGISFFTIDGSDDISSSQEKIIRQRISALIQNRDTQINIYDLDIRYTDKSYIKLADIVWDEMYLNPIAYNRSIDISFNIKNNNYELISFVYNGPYNTKEHDALYEQAVAKALAVIKPGMTEIEKARALHDYLTKTCYYHPNPVSSTRVGYTAYDALVNKKAVCNGYTLAYIELLNRVGIGVDYARSSRMNHAWNLVNLYGNWYHVDVTWDDPIILGQPLKPVSGYERKMFFLLSDNKISSIDPPHYGWIADRVCDSTIYDVKDSCLHNNTVVKGYGATCDTEGKTDGLKCSKCNKIFEPQRTIAATGHIFITDKYVAPGCTTAGKTEGSHCSKCNKVLTAQEIIPATGHKSVTDAYVAPDCTTTGKTEGSHCSNCDKVLTAQEIIPATGHNESVKITSATIGKAGEKVLTCKNCGEKRKTTINAIDSIVLSQTKYTYNGKTQTPNVTIKDSAGNILKKNTDYTVSYATGRKIPGSYAVKITYKSPYKGSDTLNYRILPKTPQITKVSRSTYYLVANWASDTTVTGFQVQYALNDKFTNSVTKTVSSTSRTNYKISNLKSNTKYYIRVRSYKKDTENGKSVTIYSPWTKTREVKTSLVYKIDSVVLSNTKYSYDGKVHTPSVTVKNSYGKTLTKDNQYTVSYGKGRKLPGSYEVKVTFNSPYKGSETLNYRILPAVPEITGTARGKTAVKIGWKPDKTVKGYQVQYALNSNFTGATLKTIQSNTVENYTATGLKSGKAYYVRVRSFVKDTENGKTVTIYSPWSEKTIIRTR